MTRIQPVILLLCVGAASLPSAQAQEPKANGVANWIDALVHSDQTGKVCGSSRRFDSAESSAMSVAKSSMEQSLVNHEVSARDRELVEVNGLRSSGARGAENASNDSRGATSLVQLGLGMLNQPESAVVNASQRNTTSTVVQANAPGNPEDQVSDRELQRIAQEAYEAGKQPVGEAAQPNLNQSPGLSPRKQHVIMRKDLVDELLAPSPPPVRIKPRISSSQEPPSHEELSDLFTPGKAFEERVQEEVQAVVTPSVDIANLRNLTPQPQDEGSVNPVGPRATEKRTEEPLRVRRIAALPSGPAPVSELAPRSEPVVELEPAPENDVNPDFLRLIGPEPTTSSPRAESVPPALSPVSPAPSGRIPSLTEFPKQRMPTPTLGTPAQPRMNKADVTETGENPVFTQRIAPKRKAVSPEVNQVPVQIPSPPAQAIEQSPMQPVPVPENVPSASCDECDGLSVSAMIGPLNDVPKIFARLETSSETFNLTDETVVTATTARNHLWSDEAYSWVSPAFSHKPLYFEQTNLERYGMGASPVAQPVISAAHFFGNIPLIPFKAIHRKPSEEFSTLGNQRPGNCVPWHAWR